jgi:hypothetical protein
MVMLTCLRGRVRFGMREWGAAPKRAKKQFFEGILKIMHTEKLKSVLLTINPLK